MFKELSVNNHIVCFQTQMFVSYVFVPKSVIIIIVIYRLSVRCFLFNSLYFMDFSVRLSIEISHTTFYFWLDLEITDRHFLFQDARSLLSTFITFHTRKHSLSNSHFSLFFAVHASVQQLRNILVFFHNLVIWFFTYFMWVNRIEL
jgi:hypothetical protein